MRLLRVLALLTAVLVVPACDEGDTILQYGGPSSGSIAVLCDDNRLFFVNPSAPSVIERILEINLPDALDAVSMAIRPATGNLYVYASDDFFYEVDLVTGIAVQASIFGLGFAPATSYPMSIDPVLDHVRIVTSVNDSGWVPVGGGFGAYTTDVSAPVRRIAFSNYFATATTTTLYGVDNTNLVRIGGIGGTPSPDNGVVTIVGPHGAIAGNGANGFAIGPSGIAYMSFGNADLDSELWRVDLNTGDGTLIGSLGTNIIRAIAVVP